MAAKRKPGAEFLCKVRYLNTLPDLPFAPKLLKVDADAHVHRLTRYQHTNLAQRQPYPMYVDADLGMPLDLVLMGSFDQRTDPNLYEVSPEDQLLMSAPVREGQPGRGRAAGVSWLRRTEYIASEMTRTLSQSKHASSVRPLGNVMDMSRSAQIAAIKRSFAQAGSMEAEGVQAWHHPSKPGVHAVESLPLLPNTKVWTDSHSHCILDADPSLASSEHELPLASTMLRPVPSATNPDNYFLAAYTPTPETQAALEEQSLTGRTAMGPLLYTHGRDYSFERRMFDDLSQLTLTLVPGEGALYTSVSSRLHLRKKRAVGSRVPLYAGYRAEQDIEGVAPSALALSFRDPTDAIPESRTNGQSEL
ncbi:hypothetical protein H4R34_000200 [Dimargaris verticillata]|uniref:Paf1-domain-containing protein n=1 Tax=Dimargaris verticillata TaxID=2761393 RepID=A0A9W8BD21_9FUNG|nr:hypothetical protein H4R34_000200 [Dimargaris verticillata]